MSRVSRTVSAILAFCLLQVLALYEDEVGQYEWLVQHVGQPTALAYSADASDRVLVASASGVVASVVLKDGSMQWRRIAAEKPIKTLKAGSKVLVSATEHGLVQGWKLSTGDLTWQREYSDTVVDVMLAGSGSKQLAIVVRSSEIEARSMGGKQEWSLAASTIGSQAKIVAAAGAEKGSEFCAVARLGKNSVAVRVEADSGKLAKKLDMAHGVNTALESSSFIVVDLQIVSLVGSTLSAHPICGDGSSYSFELSSIKSSSSVPFKLMPWQRTAGVFSATNGATTAIFGVGPQGLKHLRTFEGQAVVGPIFSVHEDEGGQPVAVAMLKEEGTQIQLLDPASGNVQPAIQAAGYTSVEHGPARLLLVRELSSGEHRTVLTAADHSIAGIQGAKVVWSREEALASIRSAFIYGRPVVAAPPKPPTAELAQLPKLIADFASKPFEIAAMFSSTPKKKAKQNSLITMMPNTKLPTSADDLKRFGANKLIIAVTRASKVFALEVTSSEIVWQKYLGGDALDPPSAAACATATDRASTIVGGCDVWAQLLSPGAAALSQLLVVVPKKGSGHDILWLDPLDAKVLHQEAVTFNIESVMELPRKGGRRSGKVHPLLIVDDALKAHVVPADSADALAVMQDSADRLFHYEVDRAKSTVQGYVVGKPGHQLTSLWNLELGSIDEQILVTTRPLHREWDQVPVHIKGDASILYKYVNGNTLAVASVDTHAKGNVSSLNLYVMDSVTGHVLHQSRILGGAAPVNLVSCDNWVVMHYWNAKKTRFEITVIELFQAKADDGPWNLLFGQAGTNQTKSAHYMETPVPLQQTYISPAGVTSLGVTATLKGITPRSILLAFTTDHIYRVSKDELNPRRPYPSGNKDDIPSQFAPTKEEGMPPYAPVMPLRSTDILTHFNPMTRVTGIVSSPTGLESTSLVFVHGLDLFFTPVQTAKAYDVLSPGFNYKLLYVSCALVIVVSIFTSYIAQYKALQERWK